MIKLFVIRYGHYQHVNKPHGCYSSHLVVISGTKIVQIPPGLDADVFTPINCALATMVAARRVAKQVNLLILAFMSSLVKLKITFLSSVTHGCNSYLLQI